jgi:hypothetical protein
VKPGRYLHYAVEGLLHLLVIVVLLYFIHQVVAFY